MIRYLLRNTKQHTATELKTFKSGCWVQTTKPSDAEINQLAQELTVDRSLLNDATDSDEMPRLETHDDKSYLFTRFAYKGTDGHIDTAPILFVVSGDFVLSFSSKHFEPIDELLNEHNNLLTTHPSSLAISLLDKCLSSYAIYLSIIGRQIKNSRKLLHDAKFSNKHFVQFVAIENTLNLFLGELRPTNNILLGLQSKNNSLSLGKNDLDALEDIQLETAQLIDKSSRNLKTITVIRDAYSNIMTNNLNRQITILTILTIVLTVPTIISSFFGMNVTVPFTDNSVGFGIIVTFSLALTIGIVVYFKRKGGL